MDVISLDENLSLELKTQTTQPKTLFSRKLLEFVETKLKL